MKDYKEFFKNKKITVMGLGLLGGVGDIKFLAEIGADLIVTDLKTPKELKPSLDILKKFKNIKYTLGEHDFRDFKNRDLIIKAPSTPLDSPYIKEARENKIPVTMWAALFSQFAIEAKSKIIGVTGTRGKTTTTAMIVQILKTAGKKVISGGNLQGTSLLLNLPKLTSKTIIILELDSWKLQGFNDLKISPNISVFTNFLPDHLNYYGSATLTTSEAMKKYFTDKSYIFKYQKNNDVLITGKQVLPFIKKWAIKPQAKIIVSRSKLPSGWSLSISGEHNIQNALFAIDVVRELGIKDNITKKALKNFKGVKGRMQFVKEVKEVKYYNDTTATTPEATIAALHALGQKKNIILIAGGSDKNLDMDKLLKQIPKYCKKVILLSGNGTDRVKDKIIEYVEVDSLKKAITNGQRFSQKGDIILFSPAFASFEMFKNEYDRGDQFVKIIKNLK